MQSQYSLRSPAVKRLMREAQELSQPTEQYHAQPLEDNLFEWHFTIRGPTDSDFDGGVYHGRIILPPDYPMKPPSIILLTPNGRFETNKKICLSISGYHPESWQPSWSIRTALLAIIGFMPTHGNGAIGSLDYTKEERSVLSKRSHSWKCGTCGDVTNQLPPVTGSSQADDAEAKKLASQINFKAEKEKEVSAPVKAATPTTPVSTTSTASPIISDSHSTVPATPKEHLNLSSVSQVTESVTPSANFSSQNNIGSQPINFGNMPYNFGALPNNFGMQPNYINMFSNYFSGANDGNQAHNNTSQPYIPHLTPLFPPPFISPPVAAMFQSVPAWDRFGYSQFAAMNPTSQQESPVSNGHQAYLNNNNESRSLNEFNNPFAALSENQETPLSKTDATCSDAVSTNISSNNIEAFSCDNKQVSVHGTSAAPLLNNVCKSDSSETHNATETVKSDTRKLSDDVNISKCDAMTAVDSDEVAESMVGDAAVCAQQKETINTDECKAINREDYSLAQDDKSKAEDDGTSVTPSSSPQSVAPVISDGANSTTMTHSQSTENLQDLRRRIMERHRQSIASVTLTRQNAELQSRRSSSDCGRVIIYLCLFIIIVLLFRRFYVLYDWSASLRK